MKRILILASLAFLFATTSEAQIAPRFAWTQGAASAAAAQAATYKLYGVGATPVTLTGVVCTGTTSPFACTAPTIALPSGTLLLRLTTTVGLLESPPSPTFSVTVPVAPAALSLIP